MFSMSRKVLSTFLLEKKLKKRGHSSEQKGRRGNSSDRDNVQIELNKT